MASQRELDLNYLKIAKIRSELSRAKRLKVGAVLVKGDSIISMGWNGTPTGS
jgi:dCMP deaminase